MSAPAVFVVRLRDDATGESVTVERVHTIEDAMASACEYLRGGASWRDAPWTVSVSALDDDEDDEVSA